MKNLRNDEVDVELEQLRVVREQFVFLLQVAVDGLLELGQELLQRVLHRVAVLDLLRRAGRVDELERRRRTVVQANLQLHLGLTLGGYFLDCHPHEKKVVS